MLLSIYLRTSVGMDSRNIAILHQLASYLALLTSRGFDWVVMGDWNMTAEELDQRWIPAVQGVMALPTEPTCKKSLPGRVID